VQKPHITVTKYLQQNKLLWGLKKLAAVTYAMRGMKVLSVRALQLWVFLQATGNG